MSSFGARSSLEDRYLMVEISYASDRFIFMLSSSDHISVVLLPLQLLLPPPLLISTRRRQMALASKEWNGLLAHSLPSHWVALSRVQRQRSVNERAALLHRWVMRAISFGLFLLMLFTCLYVVCTRPRYTWRRYSVGCIFEPLLFRYKRRKTSTVPRSRRFPRGHGWLPYPQAMHDTREASADAESWVAQ